MSDDAVSLSDTLPHLSGAHEMNGNSVFSVKFRVFKMNPEMKRCRYLAEVLSSPHRFLTC